MPTPVRVSSDDLRLIEILRQRPALRSMLLADMANYVPPRLPDVDELVGVFGQLLLPGNGPQHEAIAAAAFCDGQLTEIEVLGIGSHRSVVADPIHILRWALTRTPTPSAIAWAHSHPHSSPFPSPEDQRATRAIARAALATGLWLADAIIVSPRGYYSFAERRRDELFGDEDPRDVSLFNDHYYSEEREDEA